MLFSVRILFVVAFSFLTRCVFSVVCVVSRLFGTSVLIMRLRDSSLVFCSAAHCVLSFNLLCVSEIGFCVASSCSHLAEIGKALC